MGLVGPQGPPDKGDDQAVAAAVALGMKERWFVAQNKTMTNTVIEGLFILRCFVADTIIMPKRNRRFLNSSNTKHVVLGLNLLEHERHGQIHSPGYLRGR